MTDTTDANDIIPGFCDEPPTDPRVMEALTNCIFTQGRSDEDIAAELAAVAATCPRDAISHAIVMALRDAMRDLDDDEVDQFETPIAITMSFMEDRGLTTGRLALSAAVEIDGTIERLTNARDTAIRAAADAIAAALEAGTRELR